MKTVLLQHSLLNQQVPLDCYKGISTVLLQGQEDWKRRRAHKKDIEGLSCCKPPTIRRYARTITLLANSKGKGLGIDYYLRKDAVHENSPTQLF